MIEDIIPMIMNKIAIMSIIMVFVVIIIIWTGILLLN